MPSKLVANTGWPLRRVDPVEIAPESTEQELAALRRVDVTGALRRNTDE